MNKQGDLTMLSKIEYLVNEIKRRKTDIDYLNPPQRVIDLKPMLNQQIIMLKLKLGAV